MISFSDVILYILLVIEKKNQGAVDAYDIEYISISFKVRIMKKD